MKTIHSFFLTLFLSSFIFLNSCKKVDSVNTNRQSDPTTPVSTGNPALDELINMNPPEGFNYRTSNETRLDITILAPDDQPISNIPVNILDKSLESGGTVLFSEVTDINGKISGLINLPAYYSFVVVDPNFVGIMRNAVVAIANNSISCTIGGANVYAGNVIPNSTLGGRMSNYNNHGQRTMSVPYSYMGTYSNDGRPNYLELYNDVISKGFLFNVNASLPEGKPVPTYHPYYLAPTTTNNLNLTSASDVYITFVSEGAGLKNTIAYFTFPTGHPPATEADIDSLHIIFPNASLVGSGGFLKPGNKVKLGQFAANTSIGFAMIADGWNGTNVGPGFSTYYTVDNLNPESSSNLKRHAVLVYDNTYNRHVFGFEDLRRDWGSDNDFNDVIFYATTSTPNAASTAGINPIALPNDADGDGVPDTVDDFPLDPTRAYRNILPGRDKYGTVTFEDNWPYLGDYDVNDLVVDYKYTLINDAHNRTIEMDAEFVLKAMGATYKNGFGVELPFPASYVASVTGTRVTNNDVVSFAANGCEAGQDKAVIIPFDDASAVMGSPGGYVNTYLSTTYHVPDTIRMKILMNTPVVAENMGTVPYNPFIIINKTRGRESHLAGYTPTKKVNTSYFRTGQDNTIPAQNKYYKTVNNLPYGLSFTETFKYPVEGKAINLSYTNFVNWAQSGGTLYTNWYKDSSHIVQSYLYSH